MRTLRSEMLTAHGAQGQGDLASAFGSKDAVPTEGALCCQAVTYNKGHIEATQATDLLEEETWSFDSDKCKRLFSSLSLTLF